jgi:signal transduction histidine kinase
MLGDQLIKNERIALVELIKNSYDADSTRVEIDFRLDDPSVPDSISMTDNGDGMSEQVLKEHWLNPATPGKLARKRIESRTARGRALQGEKGIGRFAIFKLGSVATVTTRAKGSDREFVVGYDLKFLDEPGGDESTMFMDQVPVTFVSRRPSTFEGQSHGTRIEITQLRSGWSAASIERVFADVARLQPVVPEGSGKTPDFVVNFTRGGSEIKFASNPRNRLNSLLAKRSVLKISGSFNQERLELDLRINSRRELLTLDDEALSGLGVYRRYFATKRRPEGHDLQVTCGDFRFEFYVFDFRPITQVASEYYLDSEDKDLIREHRIYLYRDDVRVLPYGDPDDDWLQLDVIRGTKSAREVLSNDQTVGFVYIDQVQNPLLRDKTNREGLIESGRAYGDFVTLLQIVVAYSRAYPYAQYLIQEERKRSIRNANADAVQTELKSLAELPSLPSEARARLTKLESAYKIERDFLTLRASRTEDLAGVGLSVEAASHDIIAATDRSLSLAKTMDLELKRDDPDVKELRPAASTMVSNLSFVSDRLQDVEGLFVSTRQEPKNRRIAGFVNRVAQMFGPALRRQGIAFELEETNGILEVEVTEAVLLQVIVNLFDNAIYWLQAARTENARITCRLDATRRVLLFADSGPGIRESDLPFVFEPFYSGKGDAGKGLGLYIARQVLERSGFKIDVVLDNRHRVLPGANFEVWFGESASDDN